MAGYGDMRRVDETVVAGDEWLIEIVIGNEWTRE